MPAQLVNNGFIKRLSKTGIKTSKAFPDILPVKCGTCIDSQCKNSAVGGSLDTYGRPWRHASSRERGCISVMRAPRNFVFSQKGVFRHADTAGRVTNICWKWAESPFKNHIGHKNKQIELSILKMIQEYLIVIETSSYFHSPNPILTHTHNTQFHPKHTNEVPRDQ